MADRSVLVRIRGDASGLIRAAAAGRAAISGLGKEIDTTNDRTAWMAQSFLALGPALAPLGASAVPVLAGLAAQMTAAGLAGGSMALAFIGIGDTMKAVNDYQLEPTAENFHKMQVALDNFGPAGADFVRFLDSTGPKFDKLQMAAREGMFPGMEEGIREFMDLLPQAERIIGNVSEAIGGLSAEAGKGLAGPEFTEFFDYLESDAAPLLRDMGHTFGNFAKGLADMLVAFGPLSRDFSGGFRDMSESFADWADGLSESEGFSEFIDYVQASVPKVLDVFESLANAFLQIIEAAAPVGDVMLPALEALFDVIAAIADTPLGTVFIAAAAGMSVYGRAVALANVTTGGLGKALLGLGDGFGATLRGADGAVAKMGAIKQTAGLAAGGIGLLALSMTDLDEKAGVSNTAMGALVGTMIAPGWGTAVGAIVGGGLDIKSAMDAAAQSTENLMDAIAHGTRSEISSGIDELRDDLAALRADEEAFGSIGPAEGQSVWDKIGSDFNAIVGDSGAMTNALHAGRDAMTTSNGVADMLAGTIGKTGAQLRAAAIDADTLSASLAVLEGFFDQRAAIRNYEQSLDDLQEKLRGGAQAWDVDTKAGRDNLEMLDANATAILQVADKMKNRHARESFLQDARHDLVALRDAFPGAASAIDNVIGRLDKSLDGFEKPRKVNLDVEARKATDKTIEAIGHLLTFGKQKPKATLDADDKPVRTKVNSSEHLLDILAGKKVNPKIDVESNAAAVAAQTTSDLDRIQDEEVWITTRRRGTGLGAVAGADGMTVPGARTPYGDKIMAYLAPGEEVISNRYGQADRHRELLQAINSNAYANGGTVTRQAAVSAGGTRVIERVVEVLPGHVTLNAPGMGRMVVEVVDQRIDADRTYQNRLDDRD